MCHPYWLLIQLGYCGSSRATAPAVFLWIQAWCSGESCLTESPGRGFEAASLQILWGKGLSRFIPSSDPTYVGASGTGSALIQSCAGGRSRMNHYACISRCLNHLLVLQSWQACFVVQTCWHHQMLLWQEGATYFLGYKRAIMRAAIN